MKIAISGKGGSGKSTVTVLLARALSGMGFEVTVFDADESNMGLARMLGVSDPETVMDLYGGKQGFKRVLNAGEPINPDVSLVESKAEGIRFVRVGKIERGGEGCACLMGILAKEVLSKLKTGDREVVLVDTEAGIEHLGRGVDQSVDAILFVVDPTFDSLMLVEKAKKMALDLGVSRFMAILNKVDEQLTPLLHEKLEGMGVKVLGSIRRDDKVFMSSLKGDKLEAGVAMEDAVKIAKALVEGW